MIDLKDLDSRIQQVVLSELDKKEKMQGFPSTLFGLQIATVVDTIDPLKRGRIRYYTPFLDLNETDINGLPWASPISSFGGFDDSGCTWVPPASSKVAILFHNGNRNSAYYIGTIWQGHRGKDGQHVSFWDNRPIPEYDCLWDFKRTGYLVGDKSGDQVHMPWNTENYNGYDNDSFSDFYNNPVQYNSVTYPNIYGFKTNGKHGLKLVDGDHTCNQRYKRVELFSARGNFLMFKDDHLHPAGQWAFGDDFSLAYCRSKDGAPLENPCCEDDFNENELSFCTPKSCRPRSCPKQSKSELKQGIFSNPFFKRQEEMRPYKGAATPQNNKCELDQSGVQIQSISGHQFVQDDSVGQPTGIPSWDRDFDFGCDDTYQGKMFMRSATGHMIKIDDLEDSSKIRGVNNGISFTTASGNFFELNDHTIPSAKCTPGKAGQMSGLTAITRSSHLFRMSDNGIDQKSPIRTEGGQPEIAKTGYKGYILLRSGYGLQLLMKDSYRQDKTEEQLIHLMAPQKDNKTRGPHELVMQEKKEGPGFVMLRAGGVYYQSSYDDSVEVVGSEKNKKKSNKFTTITGSNLVNIKDYYFNHNDTTIFWSEKHIFLLAGQDCDIKDDTSQAVRDSEISQAEAIAAARAAPGTNAGKNKKGPCIYPVIVAKDPWTCPLTNRIHYSVGDDGLDSRSNRVYGSSGDENNETSN